MNYLLVIVGDCNDGDYIEQSSEVDEETVKSLYPIIEAIKNNPDSHNWQNGENAYIAMNDLYPNLTEYQIETFCEYSPTGEYGIHSIKSIKLYEIGKCVELL